MRTRNPLLAVVAAAVASACGATPEIATPSVPNAPKGDPAALPGVEQSHITYVGAFRMPNQDGSGSTNNSFGYDGHALGYDPANNSLFYGGQDWYRKFAEVASPGRISLTTTAGVLQPLRDLADGRAGQVDDGTVKLGGTLIWSLDRHGTLLVRRRRQPEHVARRLGHEPLKRRRRTRG